MDIRRKKMTVTTKKTVGQKRSIRSQKAAMLTKKAAMLSTVHLPSCTLHIQIFPYLDLGKPPPPKKKNNVFLGPGPKQQTTPTHPYNLGPCPKIDRNLEQIICLEWSNMP